MRFKHPLLWACWLFLLPQQTFSNEAEDPPQAQQASSRSAQLRWMSEQYPPYNYADKLGNARGIAVEMLTAIWEKAEIQQQPIEFLPWARSYALLLRKPETALFSMTYTPSREQLFRFVGPIIATQVVLLAPKSAALHIANISDIAALRIGVVRDDIGESLLTELGIAEEQLIYSNQADNLIQLLHRGRVDAIAYSYDVAAWNMNQAGIDPELYESIYRLLQGELGFAFHLQTSDHLIDSLQQALVEIEISGVADRIRQKYLKLRVPANTDSPLRLFPGTLP